MAARYNRILYDNYCLQSQCSQMAMRISVLESRIQLLETKLDSHSLPPSYSRKSRDKSAIFSMNQFTPIILQRPSQKTPISVEHDQYSSLTDSSDNY